MPVLLVVNGVSGLRGVHVRMEVRRTSDHLCWSLLEDPGSDSSPGKGDAHQPCQDRRQTSRRVNCCTDQDGWVDVSFEPERKRGRVKRSAPGWQPEHERVTDRNQRHKNNAVHRHLLHNLLVAEDLRLNVHGTYGKAS